MCIVGRLVGKAHGSVWHRLWIGIFISAALVIATCCSPVVGNGSKADITVTEVDTDKEVAPIGEPVEITALVRNNGPDKAGRISVEFFYIDEISRLSDFIGRVTLPGLKKDEELKAQVTWDTKGIDPGRYYFVVRATLDKGTDNEDTNNVIPREGKPKHYVSVFSREHDYLWLIPDDEKYPLLYPTGCFMGEGKNRPASLTLLNLGKVQSEGNIKDVVRTCYKANENWVHSENVLPKGVGVFLTNIDKPSPGAGNSGLRVKATTFMHFEFLQDELKTKAVNLATGFDVQLRFQFFEFDCEIPYEESAVNEVVFPKAGEILRVYPPINLWSHPKPWECGVSPVSIGTVDVRSIAGEKGIYHVIVGNQTSSLIALSPRGNKKWKEDYSFSAKVTSPVVVVDSRIYAGSSDGKLYVIEDKDDHYVDVYSIEVKLGKEVPPQPLQELTQLLVATLDDRELAIVGSEKGLHVIDLSSKEQGYIKTVETDQKREFKVTKPPINISNGGGAEIWFVAETLSGSYLASLALEKYVDVGKIDLNIRGVPMDAPAKTQLRTNALWRNNEKEEVFLFFGSEDGGIYAHNANDPNQIDEITVKPTGRNTVWGLEVAYDGKNTDVLYGTTEDGRIYKVKFKVDDGGFKEDPDEKAIADVNVITDDLAILRNEDHEALALFVTSRSPKKEIIGLDGELEELKIEKAQMWDVPDIAFRFSTGHTLMVPVVDKKSEPEPVPDDGDKHRWKLLIGSGDGVLYVLNLEAIEDI